MHQFMNPGDVHQPLGVYSQSVKVSKGAEWLTIAGQVGIDADGALHEEVYDHPVLDAHAVAAQKQLWTLQGRRGTWFCGAYFGAGFHEDGLQAGLAVAEALGGVRRPWTVADESGRIALGPLPAPAAHDRFAA